MPNTAPRPLRGRYDEIGTIHDALMETKAGTGSVLLVAGEAGCGKARLIDEARAMAASLGFRVGSAVGLADAELGPFSTLTAALLDAAVLGPERVAEQPASAERALAYIEQI